MATNTKTLISTILQQIADLRGESTVDTSASRIRAVSSAETDFAKRMFWKTHLLKDQTMVGTAANDYTIGSATFPYRQKGLTELFVQTTGSTNMTPNSGQFYIVDFNRFKDLFSNDNSVRAVYEWYDQANDLWKVHINPAPAITETITYSYYFDVPVRTLTTESVICANPDVIVNLALAIIYTSEDEIQKAQLCISQAEQLISELIGVENSPAVGQMYSMGAIENNVYPHGIGTY